MAPQSSPTLMGLPLELRTLILKHVLGFQDQGSSTVDGQDVPWKRHSILISNRFRFRNYNVHFKQPRLPHLGLFLSNKQISSEVWSVADQFAARCENGVQREMNVLVKENNRDCYITWEGPAWFWQNFSKVKIIMGGHLPWICHQSAAHTFTADSSQVEAAIELVKEFLWTKGPFRGASNERADFIVDELVINMSRDSILIPVPRAEDDEWAHEVCQTVASSFRSDHRTRTRGMGRVKVVRNGRPCEYENPHLPFVLDFV